MEPHMETLVLSAAWEPMEIVPWQRAITFTGYTPGSKP